MISSYITYNPSKTKHVVAEFLDNCEGHTFEKLKYQRHHGLDANYADNYEEGVIEGKLLLEIEFKLDSFKTISQRSSPGFLDFLGDIGGFYAALDILIFTFGQYFSKKFFQASVAGTFFLQMKTDEDDPILKSNKVIN